MLYYNRALRTKLAHVIVATADARACARAFVCGPVFLVVAAEANIAATNLSISEAAAAEAAAAAASGVKSDAALPV